MPKICGAATKPGTVKSFMIPNLKYMSEHGWNCFCISGGTFSRDELCGIKHIPMEIKWGYVGPVDFVRAVISFYRVFKRERFDVVQYATFNTAVPASIAAWLARVPVRINLQWGMSYLSAKGPEHHIKRLAEKITCCCSTSIQPDSFGNLNLSIEDGLYPASKGSVIYNGSACGVDLRKYDISHRPVWRAQLLEEYNMDAIKTIFGYVGRVTRDKGINELLESFMGIDRDDIRLWIVGPLDEVGTLDQILYSKAQGDTRIIITGPQSNVERFYSAMDFLILPSYHEGFGMTIVEAAGVGTPSIITDIKGPTDLIKDGVNGFVCEARSVASLSAVLAKAVEMKPEDYSRMADNAYRIAKKDFDSETFRRKYLENRESLLYKAQKGKR